MGKQTLLIINGAETRGVAQGQLNQLLLDIACEVLQPHFNILQTTVAEGYRVAEEQDKFKRADIVLFQYPVFWFTVPACLKAYLDEVYEYGVFFEGGEQYGQGGLLSGKRYLLSTTWNAPEAAFSNAEHFFAGRALDDVLLSMHKAQQYVGMSPLASFAAFDVVNNPQPEHLSESWRCFLRDQLVSLVEPEEASALSPEMADA